MTKQAIKEYENSCQELAVVFAKKYFTQDYELWWVADDPTGVAHINDMYFAVKDMYDYMLHKYTTKEMFERYEEEIDNSLSQKPEPFPCIRDWKKLKKQI